MNQYVMKGGNPLVGDVLISGAKLWWLRTFRMYAISM